LLGKVVVESCRIGERNSIICPVVPAEKRKKKVQCHCQQSIPQSYRNAILKRHNPITHVRNLSKLTPARSSQPQQHRISAQTIPDPCLFPHHPPVSLHDWPRALRATNERVGYRALGCLVSCSQDKSCSPEVPRGVIRRM
jgi:hypothetical protein